MFKKYKIGSIFLVLLFGIASCNQSKEVKEYNLTILMSEPLSPRSNDKFPEDFKKLCRGFESKCDKGFEYFPTPIHIKREGLSEESIKLKIDTNTGTSNKNLQFRNNWSINFFNNTNIGSYLSKPNNLPVDEVLIKGEIARFDSRYKIYYYTSRERPDSFNQKKVFSDPGLLMSAINDELCENFPEYIVIVYNPPSPPQTLPGLDSINLQQKKVKTETPKRKNNEKKIDVRKSVKHSEGAENIMPPKPLEISFKEATSINWNSVGDGYEYDITITDNDDISLAALKLHRNESERVINLPIKGLIPDRLYNIKVSSKRESRKGPSQEKTLVVIENGERIKPTCH